MSETKKPAMRYAVGSVVDVTKDGDADEKLVRIDGFMDTRTRGKEIVDRAGNRYPISAIREVFDPQKPRKPSGRKKASADAPENKD